MNWPLTSHGVQHLSLCQYNPNFVDPGCPDGMLDEEILDSSIFAQEMTRPVPLEDGVYNTESNPYIGIIMEEIFQGTTVIPTVIDVGLNPQVFRDFGVKFMVKNVKGKQYIILKGWAGVRKYYTASKYLSSNPKVAHFIVNQHSIKGAARGTVKSFALGFIVVGSLDIVEWAVSEDSNFGDLAAQLGISGAEMIVSSLAGIGAGAAFSALLVLGGFTPFGFAVYGVGLGVAISVGFLLSVAGHQNLFGYGDFTRSTKQQAHDWWEENVSKPWFRFLYQVEQAMKWELVGHDQRLYELIR